VIVPLGTRFYCRQDLSAEFLEVTLLFIFFVYGDIIVELTKFSYNIDTIKLEMINILKYLLKSSRNRKKKYVKT